MNSWWMNSLKIHAPVLLTELVVIYLLVQAVAFALQKMLPWESPRTQSQWRPFGALFNVAGIGLSIVLAFHNSLGAIGHQRQLQALLGALQSGTATASGAAAQGADAEKQKQQQAANEAKAAFLNKMAAYLDNPSIVDVEKVRAEITKDYPGLLEDKGKTVRDEYLNAITAVYQCDREFQEDIVRTLQKKRPEKSAARAKCEATPGAFFLRPLLVPEEQAQAQQKAIETLAKGEKVGEPPLSEDSARRNIALAQARLELLKKILK